MSLASSMKRPLTLVGAVAAVNLFCAAILLLLSAIDLVTGTPIKWSNLGAACFQIWIFTSIWTRGGIFKDAQAKPAQ